MLALFVAVTERTISLVGAQRWLLNKIFFYDRLSQLFWVLGIAFFVEWLIWLHKEWWFSDGR